MEKAVIYSNLKLNKENKIAWSSISLKEMNEKGITSLEGLYPACDLIKQLEGIDFAFVIKESETNPGTYKASLRSHEPYYDVSKIAVALGGGGHKTASSTAVLKDAKTIQEAASIVFETAKKLNS